MSPTVSVTIEIDIALLRRYSDEHLAMLWHVAQANPADSFADQDPGELTENIGREIIRRWLGDVEPELWRNQGRDYYWDQLRRLGKWDADRVFVPNGAGQREDES